jgi:phage shock protein C
MNTTAIDPQAHSDTRQHELRRPAQDRMLAGVAAAVAGYLGIDVAVVRVVFAVLAIVGGVGVPIYLAGWLLIPEEGSADSIAGRFVQSRKSRPR